MVQPTALNTITVFFMVVIGLFLWRYASAALVNRNPDSPMGKAMGAIIS